MQIMSKQLIHYGALSTDSTDMKINHHAIAQQGNIQMKVNKTEAERKK